MRGMQELISMDGIGFDLANRLVENVVTTISIPVGVATNVIVDGVERLVPMATEESSVVAAVCNSALQCRGTGGFFCSTTGPNMIAQVQLVAVDDPANARLKILERRDEIAELCDATDPILTGGTPPQHPFPPTPTRSLVARLPHRDYGAGLTRNTTPQALVEGFGTWKSG